jgi:hypothetical protein
LLTVALAALCLALAQGERVLEPMEQIPPSTDVRPEWYVGTGKLRFLSWVAPSTYAVLNEPVAFQFVFVGNTARAIRFAPLNGGSSVRVNFDSENVAVSLRGASYLGQLTDLRFTLNASDFGVNSGAQSYRVVLIDSSGREGEPLQMTLNFRPRTDFRVDPALERARETLSSVVPIGYFQAQQGGSLFVPSVQNFNSYSRLWFEMRLPPTLDVSSNLVSFSTAIRTGVVSLTDDGGQRYVVEWDERAVTPLPDSNGFRFALTLTPKLSSTARNLFLVQAPLRAENVPPGARLEDTVEPFRSGVRLTLPLQR